jgi:cell division protein FtsW (lipid II flippase)
MMKVVMILFMANFLVEQEESITKSLKGFFGAYNNTSNNT